MDDKIDILTKICTKCGYIYEDLYDCCAKGCQSKICLTCVDVHSIKSYMKIECNKGHDTKYNYIYCSICSDCYLKNTDLIAWNRLRRMECKLEIGRLFQIIKKLDDELIDEDIDN